MRNLLIVLILAVLAFFAWIFFAKCDAKFSCTLDQAFPPSEPPQPPTPPVEPPPPVEQPPAEPPPAEQPPAEPPPAEPPAPPTPPPGEPPLKDPTGATFSYEPPGELLTNSGQGVKSDTIYAPGMRFPLETAPAYPNSQVYGHGGGSGPAGSQCNVANYSYPWRDDFCEKRSWDTPICPSAKGHQGQDIRPATCKKGLHWAVAAEAGQITNIGSYTVTLTADSGIRYRYLHMKMDALAVALGAKVARGEHLGLVSDDFGGAATTIHLHFEIKTTVALPDGTSQIHFAPPYTSLVDSYKRLLKGAP
ncbi:MAG: M23 family metallopeptidase [Alphaproteobacteria bacterium]|nr:M23 family metallopeptidase [Alphaproteobacteria bacterium]